MDIANFSGTVALQVLIKVFALIEANCLALQIVNQHIINCTEIFLPPLDKSIYPKTVGTREMPVNSFLDSVQDLPGGYFSTILILVS